MEDNDSVSTPTLSITQCVTLKLSSTNYLLWKTQFESFLSSQSLLGLVNGGSVRPSPTITVRDGDEVSEQENSEFTKWVRKDQLVMAWLFGSLTEKALGSVYGLQSAQEVWFTLGKKYNRVSATRKLDLQRKLQGMTKGQKNMSEYLNGVKSVCDQLDSRGCPLSEQEMVYGVLAGLGKEYESICTVIEHSMDYVPELTYEDAVYKLVNFDDKLQAYNQPPETNPHMAFHTGRGYNTRGRGNYGYRGGYRGRGANSYSTRGRGFSQQFTGGSSSGNNTRPTCQICGRYGHSAARCYNRFDQDFESPETVHNALTTMKLSDQERQSGGEWYPDSAASAHITNSEARLQSSEPYAGNDQVIVGNGDYLPITHVGSIALHTSQGILKLDDVLVCPEITKSLLSVSKLTSDYPCEVTFDSDSVYVKDKGTKQVIGQGRRHKDLYMLKDEKFQAYYSSRQQATSDGVWHQRLGHPHKDILQLLVRNKAIVLSNKETQLLCDACQLGKSCRLPFLASESVSNKPLERVHCDLWGPSLVMSSQGFRYYVIFVDNYSRFTWFYPLKLKSEFYSVFVRFQKMVENLFQLKILKFQSDGGGEFVNHAFLSHLSQCGIQHLVSCPHTPQQNGISERKHRHITELGITMLFHSKAPQELWVEAFFTATFLGNLLPSSVLPDDKSPYEMLHSKPSVYTALRVFGCKCFPYLRPYMKNKLDPKSLPCVFLGYNEKYKGYRCYYPPSGKVYISRHVLFEEKSFPYSDLYSSFHNKTTSPLLYAWRKSNLNTHKAPNDQPFTLNEEEFPPLRSVVNPLPTQQTPPVSSPSPNGEEDILQHSSSSDDSTDDDAEVPEVVAPVAPDIPIHSMNTRGRSGIVKPNPRYALFTVKSAYPMPKSVKAALKDEGWNGAMNVEMDNMEETETFELVPPEEGQNPIDCGWIYKEKLNADETLLKLRARLVARGNQQEEGIDFLETFSLVVRTATIRTVLHVAITKGWSLRQLDVQNAFLHGELKETVYMIQPPRFEDATRPDYVCKLKKATYGLKQAPRAWFDKFSSFLLQFGFECSFPDPSLFIYHQGSDVIYLLLYVDDMILTGNNKELLENLMKSLNVQF